MTTKPDKSIEQIAEAKYPYSDGYSPNGPVVRTFMDGFNTAKEHPELLRDLFEEFYTLDIGNKEDFKKDFDLWIESRNKTKQTQ